MEMFQTADILHFRQYFFTDTPGQSSPHFALVILPSVLTEFKNSLYCAVITSKHPKQGEHYVKLLKKKYTCFAMDSYACFDRMDFNSIDDLSSGTQPKAKLDKEDVRKSYKYLKAALYRKGDMYLRAAIIREWKRVREE